MQKVIKSLREALAAISDSHGRHLYDEREVRSLADMLLVEVCGITPADRILCPDRQLTAVEQQRLAFVVRQMQQGMPGQQALGYAWFCDERFVVTPDVLIPRPETEELVRWILQEVPDGTSPTILDVGTGSGCIAVTLGRLIHNSQVTAIDLSTSALHIAQQNACQQGVDNLQFVQCDVLEVAERLSCGESYPPLSTIFQRGFDLIVSNPPYVCQCEAVDMSDLVLRHEPAMALFVPDDDPLRFYRAIAQLALHVLHPHGQLYFEVNAAYGLATCDLLRQLGFDDVTLRPDVTGRDRMVRAVHHQSHPTAS